MKKGITSVYGFVAYIGLLLGMVFNALWMTSSAAGMLGASLACGAVSLAAIVKSMAAEQKLIDGERR